MIDHFRFLLEVLDASTTKRRTELIVERVGILPPFTVTMNRNIILHIALRIEPRLEIKRKLMKVDFVFCFVKFTICVRRNVVFVYRLVV